jgi:hypothetical protein
MRNNDKGAEMNTTTAAHTFSHNDTFTEPTGQRVALDICTCGAAMLKGDCLGGWEELKAFMGAA